MVQIGQDERYKMVIRRAVEKDADRIMELLSQVLQLHADIRPDLFISGTTKYTREELADMFGDDSRPVYVAVDDEDVVMGYAFCVWEEQPETNNRRGFKSVYIDDLCVDQSLRGQQVGSRLFAYVKDMAAKNGCAMITLHVWEGNDGARAFYEKAGFVPEKTLMEYRL